MRGRVRIGAAAAFGLGLLALAGCGDEAKPPAQGSVPMSELRPCGTLPKPAGFRCGSIRVALEREDASLGKTKVGFAVRPRAERDRPSRGAIFAAEGGPGYSSTGTATAYVKLFGRLLRHRELVLVDQRGTGRSEPLDCPDLQQGKGQEWLTLAECGRRLGERAMSYRTEAMADDLDDVREALGYDEITLYGDSYGSFLAQSYAFRHSDTLNALVLDSTYLAEGEDPWYPDLPRRGVRSISIACQRSESCSGNARRRLGKLVDHLRDTGRGVGGLIDAIAEAGTGTFATDSYLKIDRAGQALVAGNPAPWRKLTQEDKPAYHHPRFYRRAGELVVGCNDYPMIWDKEASEEVRREQLEQAIRDYDPDAFQPFTPREMALSSEIGYMECLTWPEPASLYEPPLPEDGQAPDVPTLVVAGELDDITTPAEGKQVADLFPNSEYFEARNGGHVVSLYDSNGSAAKEIRKFLRRNIGSARP
jgi:pimeloyl-ACP methyl ester carboxylesterase